MTQVSRFKLRPDVWERIFSLFTESLIGIKDKKRFNSFLEDFLSPTERIMLAKRFAIAVLLAKGNEYQDIKNLLRVTPTTISKMSLQLKYKGAGLKPIVENALNRDATKLIWQEIQSLLDMPSKGLPLSEYRKKVSDRGKKLYKLGKEI